MVIMGKNKGQCTQGEREVSMVGWPLVILQICCEEDLFSYRPCTAKDLWQ
jgi:hypothetical protein